ncbi:hypothetical protein BHE74_00002011 [Ensete ventricosum]|nr:hypothetical protein BHE74_00002011 [Ensete ventricosum]RZS25404.1 hypothetical protein BHM03_00058595 [Ensete ventricosum]
MRSGRKPEPYEILKRRTTRQAGFTEQRLPPTLDGGRITGRSRKVGGLNALAIACKTSSSSIMDEKGGWVGPCTNMTKSITDN